MRYIRDENLPCVRAPNPILDQIAEERLAKAKELFLPSAPLGVVKRAQEAATATGVTFLLLVGLMTRLTGNLTVRIRPAILEQSGLGEDQTKRAVNALAKAGLIRVTSAAGKRREVTLIDTEYLDWLQKIEDYRPKSGHSG